MSRLADEIVYFHELFDHLQSTNSRIEKLEYIRQMPDEYKPSWEFILECLDGKHPFGYKMDVYGLCVFEGRVRFDTVKQLLEWLLLPNKNKDLSQENIFFYISSLEKSEAMFVEPIVNRTLKLGIGRSLLPLSETSPMLAKKFDENMFNKLSGNSLFYITEKLDGNRCIAYHDGIDWQFVSRNGKPMYVKFDMSQFPESMIFDGEVMTRKQTELSIARTNCSIIQEQSSTKDFSEASGIINTHSYNKDVVYNIFDIIDNCSTYEQRRSILIELKKQLQSVQTDVRIIPILACVRKDSLEDAASYWLQQMTSRGGEGVMINVGNAKYQHKRTTDLLKFKNMYTIDLKVVGLEYGTGKYEGMIGALQCIGEDGDKVIACNVGTGLSDEQRLSWALDDEKILYKIIEVGYFSLSQEKGLIGTKYYSLRFPRLIRVREDKNDTNLEV